MNRTDIPRILRDARVLAKTLSAAGVTNRVVIRIEERYWETAVSLISAQCKGAPYRTLPSSVDVEGMVVFECWSPKERQHWT